MANKKKKNHRNHWARYLLSGTAVIIIGLAFALFVSVRAGTISDVRSVMPVFLTAMLDRMDMSTGQNGTGQGGGTDGTGQDGGTEAPEAGTDTETETETETEFPETQITVSLTGDCTIGTDVYFYWDTSLNAYYEMYGPDYFFQNVRSIFETDDLTIVNMEGTLTTVDTRMDKTFAFKGDADYVQILTSGSVEAANVANNHSHDYGEQSFLDTVSTLEDAGIPTFGYDDTTILDVKGIKVGLIGIYELDTHMDVQYQLIANIQQVLNEGAQLIIVVFHWGNELETVPDSNQITLGHMAIDYGADLVVGHHPHVVQGIEKYKGRYIAYSLGNFCFGGNTNPTEMDTMIFQQTFTINSEGVKRDDNINVIPCSVSSEEYYNDYKPTPATGAEAERIMQKIEDRSAAIPEG